MGCGASNASEVNVVSPSNTGQPSSGNNSINRGRNVAVNSHLHVPLKPVNRYKNGKPITKRELDSQRLEFWGTRVEGNSLMWQNIRSAADAFLGADLVLSNAILEASNIKTPSGSLDICYDERGQQYNVPAFLFSDPIELLESSSGEGHNTDESNILNEGSSNFDTINSPFEEGLKKIRSGNPINVKVRINPGDYSISLECYSNDSILNLKRVIFEHTFQTNGTIPVCEDVRQRVMYMGKELKNNQILSQVGIADETKVVQVFMKPKR